MERLRGRGFEIELQEFAGVGHEMSAEMDALFHAWLVRAVCDVVGDVECAGGATQEPDDGGLAIDDGGVRDGSG